jgi:hypothetical protein
MMPAEMLPGCWLWAKYFHLGKKIPQNIVGPAGELTLD